MKIIAHRGASGLALENTISAIELAQILGVHAIELDIRITKDDKLVVCHDEDLHRVSGTHKKISISTLKQIQSVKLLDGESKIPTIEEAIKAAKGTPLILEMKVSGIAGKLIKCIRKHGLDNAVVASFNHNEAAKVKSLAPNTKVYLAERTNMFEIITNVRQVNADGIDFNFWLLNPLTYLFARRYKLDIMAYTINSRLLAWLIHWLYPQVMICTNHPEWFIKHPWLKLKASNSLLVKKERSQKK